MNKLIYALMVAALLLSAQPLSAQQQRQNYAPGTSPYYPPGTQVPGTPYYGGVPGGVYYGPQPGYNTHGYNYPYANQPGYGYYGASPYPYTGNLGTPVPVNGGLYRFNIHGFSGSYWKSPSGYYYPWGAGALYPAPAPVVIVNQGVSQQTQPPVTDLLRDMSTFVDEQNTRKKLKAEDYQHLSRRIKDLQSLESSFRSRNGGTLDSADEERLRKDCAMLSGDISRRVIP